MEDYGNIVWLDAVRNIRETAGQHRVSKNVDADATIDNNCSVDVETVRRSPSIYSCCTEGCETDVAVCRSYFHRTFGRLNFFGDNHQEFHDVHAWEAVVDGGFYRIMAHRGLHGISATFIPAEQREQEIFRFDISDVPERRRLFRKRDRSLEHRERVDQEISRLLDVNLDRAFLAAQLHHEGHAGQLIRPMVEIAPEIKELMRNMEVLRCMGIANVCAQADGTHRIWAGESLDGTYIIQENGFDFIPAVWLLPNSGDLIWVESEPDIERASAILFVTVDEETHPKLIGRFDAECDR